MITASIRWSNGCHDFLTNRYSRAHTWTFDGGKVIDASSSPDIVPVPMSDASAVDPEEAFVASISSCHMLWFLSIAAKAGFEVMEYRDDAVGSMQANEAGKLFIHRVTLHPIVTWSGDSEPPQDEVRQLHQKAHEECFIAHSVKTEIVIEIK